MKYIIGADEAGCGNIAGLLCVVAVKAPKDWTMTGLNDSKKLSEKKRHSLLNDLMKLVQANQISYALASKSNLEIDSHGLAAGLDSSYKEVIKELYDEESYVIWDGSRYIRGIESICKPNTYKSMIKADASLPQAMAASIIAKCYRDYDIKDKLHWEYPQYNWRKNAGYPTAEHLKAIKTYGYSPYHRKSYNIKLD